MVLFQDTGRGRSKIQKGYCGETAPELGLLRILQRANPQAQLQRPDSLSVSIWVPPFRKDVLRIRETMFATSSQITG